jgi:hypothetical protein
MKRGFLLIVILILLAIDGKAQEIWIFSEGTDQNFYDQGIVDVANLGGSLFEHTSPPGYPQYNDKVPCSTTAFKGSTSLKFNYTSAAGGNWKATIFRSGWTTADVSGMDSVSLYAYSASEVPSSALPMIGLRAMNKAGPHISYVQAIGLTIPAEHGLSSNSPSVIMNDRKRLAYNRQSVIFSQSEPITSGQPDR